MAEITAAAVKALRERTGLPMMQCKKALQEAGRRRRQGRRGSQVAGRQAPRKAWRERHRRRPHLCRPQGGRQRRRHGRNPVRVGSRGRRRRFQGPRRSDGQSAPQRPGASTPEELLAQPAPGGSGTLQELFEDTINKIREKFVVARRRPDGRSGRLVHAPRRQNRGPLPG